MPFCPKCGKSIVEGAIYCMHCGFNVAEYAKTLHPTPTPIPPQPMQVQTPPVAVQQPMVQPTPVQQPMVQPTPVQQPMVQPIMVSQQSIIHLTVGFIGGILLIVGIFFPWISFKHGGSADVPDLVKFDGAFGYLYILPIFGILVLLFSFIVTFASRIVIDQTLFPKLIFFLSIIALVISIVGMAHIASRFSDSFWGWSYSAGPFVTIVASILSTITGIVMLKSARPSYTPYQRTY